MKIAIISPIEIYPSVGGGQIRILNIIRFLLARGEDIILISPDKHENHKNISALTNLPLLDIFFVQKKQQEASSFLTRNSDIVFNRHAAKIVQKKKSDVVYVVFAWAAGVFDFLPTRVLKLLDTIDIQHKRYAQLLEQDPILAVRRFCTQKEEVVLLKKAHILIAIQKDEQAALEKMCQDKPIITIDFKPIIKKMISSETSKKILFIGNIYEPNILGIRKFIELHWNVILKALPMAELLIVGRVCEALEEIPSLYKNVRLLHFVDDLEVVYRESAVVINPVEFGTGQSVKTVEAICYGKCIISTPQGARGIDERDKLPLSVSNLEDMNKQLIQFLRDVPLRKKQEDVIYEYALHRFAEDQIYKDFAHILERHCATSNKKFTWLEKIKQHTETVRLFFTRGLL